jgi:hypothetical protein
VTGDLTRPTLIDGAAPRIHFGGHVKATFQRVGKLGHGWFGWSLDPEQAAVHIKELKSVVVDLNRPAHLGDIEISVAPPAGLTINRGLLERYAEIGVDRLVIVPPNTAFRDEAAMLAFVEATASLR